MASGSLSRFSPPQNNLAFRIRVLSQGELGFVEPTTHKSLLHGSSGGEYRLAPNWLVFFLPQVARERRKLLNLEKREEYFRLLSIPFDDGYGKKIFTMHSTSYGCILTLNKIQEKPWKPDRQWVVIVPE
jgi:hypothetical protein